MVTHQFFVESLNREEVACVLPVAEARHASKVLRLAVGDTVILMNGNGLTATARIAEMDKRGDHVACEVLERQEHVKPALNVRLYIAPPKGKNMEWVVKCATELGVARITPVICRYGVSKPDGEKESWRQTAIAACKQSRNPWLPQFDAPISFGEAVDQSCELAFLGAVPRNAAESMIDSKLALERGAGVWIGPEGGFTDEETALLLEKGAVPLTVGPCILRVETAVPALLGAIYALCFK